MSKARTRWHLVLMVLLMALLLADWKFSGDVNFPKRRRSALVKDSYGVFRSSTGVGLDPNAGSHVGFVDVAIVVWHSGWWASVERHTHVRFYLNRNDGATATPAELAVLGPQLADKRGESGRAAVLLRKGGGWHTERLPWGYVHNAVAGIVLLGIFACIVGIVWSRVVAARARERAAEGHCTSCGYPLQPSGPCPECGRDRPA